MSTEVFSNLPVANLAKSPIFWQTLGYAHTGSLTCAKPNDCGFTQQPGLAGPDDSQGN